MNALTKNELPEACQRLLAKLSIPFAQVESCEPLTGGIASDVWHLRTRSVNPVYRDICVKQALSELRVAQHWQVDIHRNSHEVLWFETVGNFFPQVVPKILAQDVATASFAMQYFPPESFAVWKSQLREGKLSIEQALQVATTLARIHQYSARLPELAARFDNHDTFFQIRIEPYFLATAKQHPDYAQQIESLAAILGETRLALVHGDVSPKNILMPVQTEKGQAENLPVFLDAECAVYGDPAFDLAFLLNHLLLKTLLCKSAVDALLPCFSRVLDAYLTFMDWESREDFEYRLQNYLGVFLLARIDGKSPVEYISDEQEKDFVRQQAKWILDQPLTPVFLASGGLPDKWRNAFHKQFLK